MEKMDLDLDASNGPTRGANGAFSTSSHRKTRNYLWRNPVLLASSILGISLGIHCYLPHACSQNARNVSIHSVIKEESEPNKETDNSEAEANLQRNRFNKPYGYYLNPILQHIQATPDQREKITAIVQSFRGRIEPLSEEYRKKNQEFLSNLARGEHSEVIMDEQAHLGRLFSDITLSYCQMSLEVRKVLSPEQVVRYEEFKRQRGWVSAKHPY